MAARSRAEPTQDLRYICKSRRLDLQLDCLLWSLECTFVCRGDDERLEPSYSQLLKLQRMARKSAALAEGIHVEFLPQSAEEPLPIGDASIAQSSLLGPCVPPQILQRRFAR